MTSIQPLQQTVQLVNPDGTYTSVFKRYLDLLLARVGGITGGVYVALSVNSGSFIWSLNSAPTAVVRLANNTNTLVAPPDMIAGGFYRLTVVQPASGAKGLISWPKPPFVFPGGIIPTLSTANNAIDEFWFSSDGTSMKLCVSALNFS